MPEFLARFRIERAQITREAHDEFVAAGRLYDEGRAVCADDARLLSAKAVSTFADVDRGFIIFPNRAAILFVERDQMRTFSGSMIDETQVSAQNRGGTA